MTRKQQKHITQIIAGAVTFAVALVLSYTFNLEGLIKFIVFLVPYAIIGWNILWKAIRNILRGQIFDENFLMAVATVGAFALGDYSEGVVVMLFYQVGEWFQSYAVGKSRKSIAGLMDIRPDHANLLMNDGSITQVSPEEVTIGQTIIIKPGERVPLDGVVMQGTSTLDTSALTGESAPRDIFEGSEIISGTINQTGTLTVAVKKPYGESTVAKILDLVENSSSKKAKAENFITRFARYYTPAVCFAALALAILPPLILGQPFQPWVYRALTFLVISCPCALVISVPLSFFGGIGGASKAGVLVKGSNYLELLAQVDTVVFDKTGTLTQGSFAVTQVQPNGLTQAELLEIAALAEYYSTHPIAASIKAAYGKQIDVSRLADVNEQAGHGIVAKVDGHTVLAGNARMMQAHGITADAAAQAGTVIYLARNGEYIGFILIEDIIKQDAPQAISSLKQLGISRTVMLTGDNDAVGRRVAASLGLDDVYTELLPADKVAKVEELLAQEGKKGRLAFVGDGINDAPVLARADVGIAMGGLGSDAAIEAADVVIMTDEPSLIARVIRIGRKTMRIVHQNIVFALVIKLVVLLLAAAGFASMWAGVFADVGVSVLAILNAMRALNIKNT